MQTLRVTVTMGTRPEAIKLLPVVAALREHPAEISCRVVATGQHRELLEQVFEAFAAAPDQNLNLMEPGQSLERSFSRALAGMGDELKDRAPDLLLVEGDTTTVFASALAAFWRGCPVGHVEAGLRSGDRHNPFPEEMNRILTGSLADIHFAPTQEAAGNLLNVGVSRERIFVSGNTVVDALLSVAGSVNGIPPHLRVDPGRRILLVTVHRRESFGNPLVAILTALKQIVRRFSDVLIVLPVHPNPRVAETVHNVIAGEPRVHLVPPLGYRDFVAVLKASHLVLSDSGGVQEEAPVLGKPVLVLRNTTERPEGIACGVARLVGTDSDRIVREAARLLEDAGAYAAAARPVSPYGDGNAARRIVEAILYHFKRRPDRPADFVPQATGRGGGRGA